MDLIGIQNKKALTEAQSKHLLSKYGVPTVTEKVVYSAGEAIKWAGYMGYPVVLKALGANITHKTERGLVKLGLYSDEAVSRAFLSLNESAADDWEGCLVQKMIDGKRELCAGLIRDPQFGPVVMFGLGGVFTEALQDRIFRIAPLNRLIIEDMLEGISSRKLLHFFRGEAAADREQLIQTLLGLSRLGMENPEIQEIDINPLIISPDGKVTAVDALVVMEMKDK